ncbi:MAG TPA: hypothetical protein PK082_03750, partial [Phycisphaerae bacterium]|nr:hypothetical protein [Phycisphaerae bacterium]
LIAAAAPVGTTICGVVAVSRIRRSDGRLYGLGLALADSLLFPLLVLDGIIGFCLVALVQVLTGARLNLAAGIVLTIPLCALVDFFIVRWAWRAANRPIGTGVKPDTLNQTTVEGGTPAVESARQAVKAPAIGLAFAAGISLAVLFAMIAVVAVFRRIPGVDIEPWVLALLILGLSPNIFVFFAALGMMNLKGRTSAIVASVLALILSPGNLIGLPMGIWALVVLCRREVVEAFKAARLGATLKRGVLEGAKPDTLAASESGKSAGAVLGTLAWHAALLVLMLAYFFFAVPRFTRIFAEMGAALPGLTMLTIESVRFVRKFAIPLFGGLFGLDAAVCFLLTSLGGRKARRWWSAAIVVALVLLAVFLTATLYLPMRSMERAMSFATQPATQPAPVPVENAACPLDATIYELHLPPASAGSLDAAGLTEAAADPKEFDRVLARLGKAKVLYRMDQSVKLSGDRVSVQDRVPVVIATRTNDEGQILRTVAYQSVGAVLNVSGKALPGGELAAELNLEIAALADSSVKIANNVSAPVTRKVVLVHKGPVAPGRAVVMVSADANSLDADGQALAFVARVVLGKPAASPHPATKPANELARLSREILRHRLENQVSNLLRLDRPGDRLSDPNHVDRVLADTAAGAKIGIRRLAAARLMEWADQQKVVTRLAELARDEDGFVKLRAAQVLALSGRREDVTFLRDIASGKRGFSSSGFERDDAAWTLLALSETLPAAANNHSAFFDKILEELRTLQHAGRAIPPDVLSRLADRIQPVPATRRETWPVGSRLEFRIAPKPSAFGFGKEQLAVGNPPASGYKWLPIWGELTNAPGLVMGEYDGQKCVLVSDKPGQKMVRGEDKDAWGLLNVYATKDHANQPAVGFELDERGAERFAALTRANIDNALAIVVDGRIVSAPVVKSALGKTGIITGRFTEQEVAALVHNLRAGMQPATQPATQPAR